MDPPLFLLPTLTPSASLHPMHSESIPWSFRFTLLKIQLHHCSVELSQQTNPTLGFPEGLDHNKGAACRCTKWDQTQMNWWICLMNSRIYKINSTFRYFTRKRSHIFPSTDSPLPTATQRTGLNTKNSTQDHQNHLLCSEKNHSLRKP